jgi:uncharacterized protein
MRLLGRSTRSRFGPLCAVNGALVAAGLMLALLLPAQAQFWSPFGFGPQRRPPAPVQQQQPGFGQGYNPFGGFFGPPEPPRREAAPPPDYSHAPAPQPRKADTAPTMSIVVMGDAMADWLAYGLEDAYTERPEIGVVRKNRTASGLVRYDTRRDVDWAQTAREIIAAEKPKFIVMMIGVNDHQVIRERTPPPAKPAAGAAGKPGTPPPPPPAPAAESAPPPSEDVAGADAESPDQPVAEAGRNASPSGPFEFHTEQWEAAYIKRIDATIAALKSGGVPVLWVGLPAQRGPKATADSSYLNELYRSRAERAGITYVDVWDGFVDEQGRYAPQGPDFEGQTRRLRSADGVYFTRAGARKLAHYVEREIDRSMTNRIGPMALPSPVEVGPAGAKPGGSARPLAGPVIPLTVSVTGAASDELLGGARPPARPSTTDPLVTRVLTKGEAVAPPAGRADDFSWPRGGATTLTGEPPARPATAVTAVPPAPAAAPANSSPKPPASSPAAPVTTDAQASGASTAQLDGAPDDKPKAAKKPAAPRPPAVVRPFATIPNIFR